jgi:uncharacterized membrane protein YbhN (UPF0104 family)
MGAEGTSRRRVLRLVVSAAVIAMVATFFAISLSQNWTRVAAEQLEFSWWWILGAVLFAAAVPVTGLLWRRILIALDGDITVSRTEAVAVQCASWLLKYVPGQLGAVTNKVVWAGRKQVSRVLVVVTFVYEHAFQVIVSIAPSVVILAFALGAEVTGRNATTLLLPLVALLPLAIIAYRPAFHRIVSVLLRRVLKQEIPKQYFLSTGLVLRFLFEFLGPRVLNGAAFVIIAGTVVEVEPQEWVPFAAAYVLAEAVGLLAVFVPSGLGVREAVIVLVLSQFMPLTDAIVISLLARLISTAGDGLVALVYAVFRQLAQRELRP